MYTTLLKTSKQKLNKRTKKQETDSLKTVRNKGLVTNKIINNLNSPAVCKFHAEFSTVDCLENTTDFNEYRRGSPLEGRQPSKSRKRGIIS
jgi:hypothetical protein